MVGVEASVRELINGDRDCAQQAQAQMDRRRKVDLLISKWKAAGGGGVMPDVRDRVRLCLVSRNEKSPASPRGFCPSWLD